MFVPGLVAPVSAAAQDRSICENDDFKTYLWSDDAHPPPYIFVLRKNGPNAGRVEKVPFWKYVGTVLRTEYSGSGPAGQVWQNIGAITVKQYGWYYVARWRGGKVSTTVTDPVTGASTTRVECYHVKDTTADQLYKPEQWDPTIEAWVPKNVPSGQNLAAMRDTWQVTLRKWLATKNKTAMFLSGYRSGNSVPCGSDGVGTQVRQASLRDCIRKGLTFEESLRKYFEPVYLVDTRGHDILGDSEAYRGDLAVLVPDGSGAQARIYRGTATGQFGTPIAKAFGDVAFDSIRGQGVGNVHSASLEKTGDDTDTGLHADLLVLTTDRLWLARATGRSFATPVGTAVSGVNRLVVDDFDGDRLADAGLVGNGGLEVMRSAGTGSFNPAAAWLSADLSLASAVYVGAGDFNGDGKADLLARDASGTYSSALSRASCANLASVGDCPAGAVGQPGLKPLGPAIGALAELAGNVKHVVGDYDRDGRDDLIAIAPHSSGIKVLGLRSLGDGTFANPLNLGVFSFQYSSVQPVAMDVNPDGMVDVALVSAGSISWLRTAERKTTPAYMDPITPTRTLTGSDSLPAGFIAF